jgi:hypothetical protein
MPSFKIYMNLFFLTTLTLFDLDGFATQLLDTTEKKAKDFIGLLEGDIKGFFTT